MPPVTPSRIFAIARILPSIRPAGSPALPDCSPTKAEANDLSNTPRHAREARLRSTRPKCSHFGRSALALLVRVLELALGNLFQRHRQVVLGARLDEWRREVVERALAQLVVVVVDLPGALRRDDDKRVARVDLFHELIDAGMDHRPDMVAARSSSRSTMAASRSAARSRSSFSIR